MAESDVPRPPALEPLPRTVRKPSLGSALAAQRQLPTFIETMPDGTRVLYRTDGVPVRQWNLDGSIVTFDVQGRPVARTTADSAEQPVAGEASTAPRPGLVVRRVDQADGRGRPLEVTFPDGTRARYEYEPDGRRIARYSTGVVTTEDAAGRVLVEWLPDGTVLDGFDRRGRPTAGVAPGDARFTVAYDAKGNSSWRFADGSTVEYSPAKGAIRKIAPAGTPLAASAAADGPTPVAAPQQVADGTTAESPAESVIRQIAAAAQAFAVSVAAREEMLDGQLAPPAGTASGGAGFTASQQPATGDMPSQVADGGGSVSSSGGQAVPQVAARTAAPDGQLAPPAGTASGGAGFTASQQPARGDMPSQVAGGGGPASSSGGQAVPQVAARTAAPDGQLAPPAGTASGGAGFTASQQPARGDMPSQVAGGGGPVSSPGGRGVPIAAAGTALAATAGSGGSTPDTAPGGARVATSQPARGDIAPQVAGGGGPVSSPGGQAVPQVAARGTTDGQGSPPSVAAPGAARSTTTYTPQADSPQQPSAGGLAAPAPAAAAPAAAAAVPAMAAAPDGQGRPTSGTLPDGTPFTVTYDAQGDALETLPDGTTVEYSPQGQVLREVAPDGTAFTGFDDQGRPTSGTLPDGTPFTLTYDAKGDAFETLPDGTTVEYDPNGNPIQMTTPDGRVVDFTVDLPALEAAIGGVRGELAVIEFTTALLDGTFDEIEGHWMGPAAASFPPLRQAFMTAANQLIELLQDGVNRMQTAYTNYASTESTNAGNLD